MSNVTATSLIAETISKHRHYAPDDDCGVSDKCDCGFDLITDENDNNGPMIMDAHDEHVAQVVADALERVTVPSENEREALGELLALVGDHDGCHQRVRDWEAQEEWEREAQPDEEPHGDREEAEWWNKRADAALVWFSFRPPAPVAEEANSAARPRIDLNAARLVLEQWDDADELLAFAATNWQLLRANYRALLEAAVAVPVEPGTPEPFPESSHVDSKYWAELVRARRRIAELEAVEPKPPVHNHGPDEGRGLDCNERIVDGNLQGACMRSVAPVPHETGDTQ